jgi:hypothetical protein
MEDNLIFFLKWKTTSIVLQMEDNLNSFEIKLNNNWKFVKVEW